MQEFLSMNGIGFRTQVLEIIEKSHPLDNYVRLCIRTRLRVNGKIVCRRVYTLIEKELKPKTGDRVHIRYNPCNPENVLLCSITNR